ILGLVLYTSIEQRTEAMAEAKASALRLVRMAATGQRQHLEAGKQLLITLAQLAEVRQGNAKACEALFSNLLTVHRVYANFGLIAPDGQLIAGGIPGRRAYLGDRSYFQRAKETMKFAVGDYQKGRVTARPTLNLGYPVRDLSGNFSGVIYA